MTGRPTAEQVDFIRFLNEKHYFACVCRGWQNARDVIVWYLDLPRTTNELLVIEIPVHAIYSL